MSLSSLSQIPSWSKSEHVLTTLINKQLSASIEANWIVSPDVSEIVNELGSIQIFDPPKFVKVRNGIGFGPNWVAVGGKKLAGWVISLGKSNPNKNPVDPTLLVPKNKFAKSKLDVAASGS